MSAAKELIPRSPQEALLPGGQPSGPRAMEQLQPGAQLRPQLQPGAQLRPQLQPGAQLSLRSCSLGHSFCSLCQGTLCQLGLCSWDHRCNHSSSYNSDHKCSLGNYCCSHLQVNCSLDRQVCPGSTCWSSLAFQTTTYKDHQSSTCSFQPDHSTTRAQQQPSHLDSFQQHSRV